MGKGNDFVQFGEKDLIYDRGISRSASIEQTLLRLTKTKS